MNEIKVVKQLNAMECDVMLGFLWDFFSLLPAIMSNQRERKCS